MQSANTQNEKKVIVLVVGYCPPTKVNEEEALKKVQDIFNKIEQDYPQTEIDLVSGLTNVGIMRQVYPEGKKRGWYLVGYACKKAENFDKYPVDEAHIIGENWGNESEAFTDHAIKSGHPYIIVNVGGGPQSLDETLRIIASGGKAILVPLQKIQ